MEKNPKNIDNAGVAVDAGQDAGQSVGKWGKLSRFLAWKLRAEEGMATAEYAIGTLAAAAFAGLLLMIMKGGEIKDALQHIIQTALQI